MTEDELKQVVDAVFSKAENDAKAAKAEVAKVKAEARAKLKALLSKIGLHAQTGSIGAALGGVLSHFLFH